MSDTEQYGGISRRTLVKSSAIGSLALAAGGLSLPFGMRTAAAAVQQAIQPAEESGLGRVFRKLRQPLCPATPRQR